MPPEKHASAVAQGRSVQAGGLRVWHLFLVLALVGAAVAVRLSPDTRPESLVMISLAAISAVAAGVALHRTLMPFAEAPAEAEPLRLSARARAALEREKMLVLRSIKELEFDRAMGKVADADFAEMTGRLRSRAIGLMQQLDAEAEGYRSLIEREVAARLGSARVASGATEERADASAAVRVADHQASTGRVCAACGTRNDSDARFCKSCGARIDEHAARS